MPNLGRKYTCYSCHTKFYDLGKPEPLCPKCGADQRDAEETPILTSHRGRRVVEEPEEPEFGEAESPAVATETDDEDGDIIPEPEKEESDEEEEDY